MIPLRISLIPNLFRSEEDQSWNVEQVIWTFLFSVIVVIAIMGNAMVLWIILAHRTMWSVPNYFLLNLTIADLLMAALNCVPRWNISPPFHSSSDDSFQLPVYERPRLAFWRLLPCQQLHRLPHSVSKVQILTVSNSHRVSHNPISRCDNILRIFCLIYLLFRINLLPFKIVNNQVNYFIFFPNQFCFIVHPMLFHVVQYFASFFVKSL